MNEAPATVHLFPWLDRPSPCGADADADKTLVLQTALNEPARVTCQGCHEYLLGVISERSTR